MKCKLLLFFLVFLVFIVSSVAYTAPQPDNIVLTFGHEPYTATDGANIVLKFLEGPGDVTAPLINFTDPTISSGANLTQDWIHATVTATDETSLSAVTIYLWNDSELLFTVANTTSFFTNFTDLFEGNYKLNASAEDSSGNRDQTETRNITVDATPPRLNYTSPTGNGLQNSTHVMVTVTAADLHLDIVNISLWNADGTYNTSTIGTSANFSGLVNGTYFINVTANDTKGNTNFTVTRTILIDSFVPRIQFEAQTTSAGKHNQTHIYAHVTAVDGNLDTINITIWNSTGSLVSSNLSTSSPLVLNSSGLADGLYFLNATVNDTVGFTNSTETRRIILDVTAPNVNLIEPTPADGDLINVTYLNVRATASDSFNLTSVNITIYNSTRHQIASNTSTTSPVSINLTGLVEGSYYVNATAIDSQGHFNKTETRNITIAIPICFVTLNLDGINDTRNYELETRIVLTANTFDKTGTLQTVNTSIFVNHTDGILTNDSYNFTPVRLIISLFGDENLTQNLVSGKDTYFLMNNISYPIDSNLSVSSFSSSVLPTDVHIFVGNMTVPVAILPGKLNGTILQQVNLSTGVSSRNITFLTAGSTLVFVNLSKLSKSAGNLSMVISGQDLDKGNDFSFQEFYRNLNFVALGLTDASTYWMWDDFTTNRTSQWINSSGGNPTFHGADGESRHLNVSSFASCTGGGSSCSSFDTDTAFERTVNFDAEESGRIMVKLGCSVTDSTTGAYCGSTNFFATAQQSGFCEYSFSENDSDSELYTYSSDGFENTTIELIQINTSLGIWNVTKDGVFIKNVTFFRENLELKFGVQSFAAVQVPAPCDPGTTKSIKSNTHSFIYFINTTGVGNPWNGSQYDTASTLTSKIVNTAPNDISRVILEVEEFKPAESTITYELSNDNGTTWTRGLNNTFTIFLSAGNNLTYRVNLTSNETNTTPRVRNIKLSIIPSALENVSFDFGADGTEDFSFTGILNGTFSPRNISLNFSDSGMASFIDSLPETTGLFPIKITTDTTGTLSIDNLLFKTNVSRVAFNTSDVEIDQNCVGDCRIKVNATYSTGTLVLSGLSANYKGRGNFTIIATSNNASCSVGTHLAQIYYSKINVSFPSGTSFYGVFPSTVNSKNVAPFGQKTTINATSSIPIFRIRGDRNFSWDYSIYESFAPNISSCLSLNSCTTWNKTSCKVINTTSKLQYRNVTSNATNEIYHFWNLSSCSTDNLFLPANMTFEPYCSGCLVK